MRSFKTSFFWQFAGGFVIGTVGLLAFQPASATRAFASHFVAAEQVRR